MPEVKISSIRGLSAQWCAAGGRDWGVAGKVWQHHTYGQGAGQEHGPWTRIFSIPTTPTRTQHPYTPPVPVPNTRTHTQHLYPTPVPVPANTRTQVLVPVPVPNTRTHHSYPYLYPYLYPYPWNTCTQHPYPYLTPVPNTRTRTQHPYPTLVPVPVPNTRTQHPYPPLIPVPVPVPNTCTQHPYAYLTPVPVPNTRTQHSYPYPTPVPNSRTRTQHPYPTAVPVPRRTRTLTRTTRSKHNREAWFHCFWNLFYICSILFREFQNILRSWQVDLGQNSTRYAEVPFGNHLPWAQKPHQEHPGTTCSSQFNITSTFHLHSQVQPSHQVAGRSAGASTTKQWHHDSSICNARLAVLRCGKTNFRRFETERFGDL